MEAEKIHRFLAGKPIHDIHDWKESLQRADAFANREEASKIGGWLNSMFGRWILAATCETTQRVKLKPLNTVNE